MAKDAKGHGSEKRGGSDAPAQELARFQAVRGSYRRDGTLIPGYGGVLSGDQAAASELGQGHPKSGTVEAHPGTAGRGGVTIFHQDGEYAVPNGAKNKHYFTNDKQDAEDTARHIHGQGISIKHRSKRWGPEMD